MEVFCPKCSRKQTLSAAELASREALQAVVCAGCGDKFDARSVLAKREIPNDLKRLPQVPENPPKAARRLPKSIASYEVLAEISRGGMGIVYKALDRQLRREVAIKVLLAGEGASEEDVKRFHREAQATARLHHPNIVPIYAVGIHEGKPYLVMDFVEGHTAKQLKEDGTMNARLALVIAEGAAEGLHHAHLHGVVHRDVKPANIIVDKNERVQLMDFGLARRVDEDLEITQSGTTMGTPSYMSPEQAEGKLTEVDAQSDVYSLGACFYELLTGRAPFDGPTIMTVLRSVLEDDPVPPRKLNPQIHVDVETICLKCLEKPKHQRYSSAKQLAEDIRRFNSGEPILARPQGFFGAMRRKIRQHKEFAIALLLLVVGTFSALAYSINESRNLERQRKDELEASLRTALATGDAELRMAQSELEKVAGSSKLNFESTSERVKQHLQEAGAAFGHAEMLVPQSQESRSGMKAVRKLEKNLEVRRFIYNANEFLNPPPPKPGEPPVLPNYAAAEYAAQLALTRDPENSEARELQRIAMGIREIAIDSDPPGAEVSFKRVMDSLGRPLSVDPAEPGKSLGTTPVTGKYLEPGLHIITFKLGTAPLQQGTLWVSREARAEDLVLRLPLNSSRENMAAIPEGSVPLPERGPVTVAAFSIDRFEYPNKAGAIPTTGVTLLEARDACVRQEKQLCTSAQWLRACMGDNEWRYPYGKTYVSGTCAVGMDGDAQKTPQVSGFFSRCRTPEGVYDMSGNVAEWTDSQESGDSEQQEIIFGGDWLSSTKAADLSISCRARSLPPEVNKERLGFRCCRKK